MPKEPKRRRYWRLVDTAGGARTAFATFDDAMTELAKKPGAWCAWFTQDTVGKGDHRVERAWGDDQCETQPNAASTPP